MMVAVVLYEALAIVLAVTNYVIFRWRDVEPASRLVVAGLCMGLGDAVRLGLDRGDTRPFRTVVLIAPLLLTAVPWSSLAELRRRAFARRHALDRT